MRHLLLLICLFAILLSSCLFPDTKGTPKKIATGVPVEETGRPDGSVYLDPSAYAPGLGSTNHEQDNDPLDVGYMDTYVDAGDSSSTPEGVGKIVCLSEEYTHTTSTKTANKSFITFISDTIQRTVEVDPQDVGDSDFVFLKSVEVEVVEGNDLRFVDWIRVYLDDDVLGRVLLAWGGAPARGAKVVSLQVDGQVDVKKELVDGTELDIEVRGSAPATTTKIVAHLTFIKLIDCRQE